MSQKPNNYEHLYRTGASIQPNREPVPPQPFVLKEEAENLPNEPASPPQPFVLNSADMEMADQDGVGANHTDSPYDTLFKDSIPHQQPVMQQAPPPVRTLPPPVPPKPKAPFSPIPLLLVAGVVFLFLGGVIFLTNTWDSLPNAARAISLLSASVIAFGANILAERVLRLPKTGLAFYIIGCIFLPMAMAGIGAFALFGDWFSFDGDGWSLVWTLIFACVAAPAFLGQNSYKSPFLAWLGLSGTGTSWLFLSIFFVTELDLSINTIDVILSGLLLLFAIGATVWTEWYLSKKQDTPLAKAAVFFLMPLLCGYAITMLVLLADEGVAVSGMIIMLVMAVLFTNSRFISGAFHTGVFGFIFCLLSAAGLLTNLPALDTDTGAEMLFAIGITSFLLMGTLWIPKARPELVGTFSIAGMVISLPVLAIGSIASLVAADSREDAAGFMACLYLGLFISMLFFAFEKKNMLSKKTVAFCIHFTLLFITASLNAGEPDTLYTLLLVISALLLMTESFLEKRMSSLVLAIGSCCAVLMQGLPHPLIWLGWLCTVGLLGGVIYAHSSQRYLLEKSCAWVGIPFLLSTFALTLYLWMEALPLWSLLLSLLTLLYLLETVVFWKHSRSEATGKYLEVLALFVSFVVFVGFLSENPFGGWGFLILLNMLVFTVTCVRKPKNAISIPYLVMLFFTARHMIAFLERGWLIHDAMWLHTAQIGCFLLILAAFAAMGRILLPYGFYDNTDGRMQVDFPLLAGIFPVFGAAGTIDWYPSMVCSLFLALYSLLYIGRVKNHSIPALLASFFGCATIFFHNVNDPWNLLHIWREIDVKTPQILLYVLPLHLFILSLLWILPQKCRNGIHIARFCMYCFTMLCLLNASFSFGQVADALILMIFSFAILVGSFTIKRLRWFTLGFAVLFVETVRLTHSFWRSLHWGIYLFLAGGVLIGIAFWFELSARKAAEHPDEPKKKFKPFAAWRW